jgi:hypothetical protein
VAVSRLRALDAMYVATFVLPCFPQLRLWKLSNGGWTLSFDGVIRALCVRRCYLPGTGNLEFAISPIELDGLFGNKELVPDQFILVEISGAVIDSPFCHDEDVKDPGRGSIGYECDLGGRSRGWLAERS